MTDLIAKVHPDDGMYTGDLNVYLKVGETVVTTLRAGLEKMGRDACDVRSILDFACGHGRVMRHLKHAYPRATLAGADYDTKAVEFCSETFGCTGYASSKSFDIDCDDTFDLIWVGSLHTHLTVPDWEMLTRALQNRLTSNGVLAFSTAGPFVADLLSAQDTGGLYADDVERVKSQFADRGFAYAPYMEKILKPTDPPGWGRAFVKPSWVETFMAEHSQLQLATYIERGYGGRQDVYFCTPKAR